MWFTVIETRKGHIHRIVESLGMGYIAEPENDRLWPFLFSQIAGYAGEYPEEIGLSDEVPVEFTVNGDILVNVMFAISKKSFVQSNAN